MNFYTCLLKQTNKCPPYPGGCSKATPVTHTGYLLSVNVICSQCFLLWKGVKAVGLFSVRKGHSHSRHKRGVENDGGALVARRQVHRWHCSDALTVHNHVLRPDAVPGKKRQKILNGQTPDIMVMVHPTMQAQNILIKIMLPLRMMNIHSGVWWFFSLGQTTYIQW